MDVIVFTIVEMIVFAGITIIVIRFLAQRDRGRIDEYLHEKGGQLLDLRWNPFGRGWLRRDEVRTYRIYYRDRQGTIHRAICKISISSGIYLIEDQIVPNVPSRRIETSTADEKQRLRQELEQLKRRQG